MRLYAALVPPPDVLTQVQAVLTSVAPVPDDTEEERSGWLRLGRRRTATAPAPTGPALDLLPIEDIHLPLAKFGNVALPDVARLADALEEDAATWESPRLRLSGGVSSEDPRDSAVEVRMAGDVDAVEILRRGVTLVGQSLQLFVDRRGFRPHLQVATANERSTGPYLESVVSALDAFESNAWWQTSIVLVTPVDQGPGKPPYRVHREVVMGPAVPH
jgi:2'-5' RNA ligase